MNSVTAGRPAATPLGPKVCSCFTFCCTMRQHRGVGCLQAPQRLPSGTPGERLFRPPTMEGPLELTDSGLQRFLLGLQVPHSGCFREHVLFGAAQRSEGRPAAWPAVTFACSSNCSEKTSQAFSMLAGEPSISSHPSAGAQLLRTAATGYRTLCGGHMFSCPGTDSSHIWPGPGPLRQVSKWVRGPWLWELEEDVWNRRQSRHTVLRLIGLNQPHHRMQPAAPVLSQQPPHETASPLCTLQRQRWLTARLLTQGYLQYVCKMDGACTAFHLIGLAGRQVRATNWPAREPDQVYFPCRAS